MNRACALVLLVLLLGTHAPVPVRAQNDEQIRLLLARIEQAARAGDPQAYLALVSPAADRKRAEDFAATEFRTGATRALLKERSRAPVAEAPPETGYRIMLDSLVEFGGRARIATWHFDVRRTGDTWAVVNQARLSAVGNLYRLAITPDKQFTARDFTVHAEDLDLTLIEGSVFTVEIPNRGVAALVLLGRGVMKFHPTPRVEKEQLRIFGGSENLETPFEAAYVRAGDMTTHANLSTLTAKPVDPRELKRAEDVFREESPKTFAIDMGDLAPGNWTSLPATTDVVAEVRTRRFGTLTYSRSEDADEDISLFDRARNKNISVYPSADRIASRGPFYDEDAKVPYDIIDYDINLSFAPDRRWFDALARMKTRIKTANTSQVTLRLADTLAVQNVTSDEFGSLFSVRVRNQNTLLVNLPVALPQGAELNITVEYSGRVPGQTAEWENLPFTQRELDQLQNTTDATAPLDSRPEPIYVYGNRSFWYPRAPVFDYATATLRMWVPSDFDCVASGELTPGSPTLDDVDPARHRKLYVFNATRPLRNLSFLVTRLVPIERATVAFSEDAGATGKLQAPAMGGAVYNTLDLTVYAHRRAVSRAPALVTQAVDIVQFYRSLIGDTPYSALTLAAVEGNSAGGHSPGYVAAVRRRASTAPQPYRNDPAAVEAYSEFAPAHDIAHQWWGQAVGWKTYHDQWMSEALSQYFAALYVQHTRGDEAFRVVLRQMRRWGMEESPQGPLTLGYRLGHVKDDGRVFRALVYNKGAAVLHMLRRIVGDEAFFLGLRRFYASWRFEKAGTLDFRRAMEAESGRSLEQFFDRWVFDSSLPQLKFSYRVDGRESEDRAVVLRVEQIGPMFEVPVTVLLHFADRPTTEVTVSAADRTTELRVPLVGSLRRVELREDATLAEIQR